MVITKKLGNINTIPTNNLQIDVVGIEWYEAGKRILHKQTSSGMDVTMKFLKENPNLEDGDILWHDKSLIVAVQIKPCECIVIKPATILAASSVCYEIGNRHLPLFYEGDALLIPYEVPLYNLLRASGYDVKVEERKLRASLKTTVLPHLRVDGTVSLPGKIFQLATSS